MKDKLRLHWLVPPIVPYAARKVIGALRKRESVPAINSESVENPRWCRICSGPLAGRSLYMNPEAQAYQASMLDGTFDKVFFDYIDRWDWRGSTIYDIGAHIGYHTLNFAHRVGANGRVFSFEPHPTHQERLNTNLSRSPDLADRVTLIPIAAGNRNGPVEFYITESVEGGGSSGSFAEGASTPFPRSHYADHRAIQVESARLDDLVMAGRCAMPDLMKIDVEGAESLVIEGSREVLRKSKPLILMEVHSQPNMMYVTTLLVPLGYTFVLLEDAGHRCFVAVEPPITEKNPVLKPRAIPLVKPDSLSLH
jgi:FkbM family methyltransferase